MSRFLKDTTSKVGKAPGSLIFVGTKRVEQTRIDVIMYDLETYESFENVDINSIPAYKDDSRVSWINVIGVHDPDTINALGTIFDIHPLLLEDIMHTGQRPKFLEYTTNLFMFFKMLEVNIERRLIESEQLTMVLGNTYLVTFQEAPGDVFSPVRDRLERGTTRIRSRGADYLAYALLDTVIDTYISITERFGERIESLESQMLEKATEVHLRKISSYKREINFLRKTVRPVRELASQFQRSESDLIADETVPFLSDLNDHITQGTEAVEVYHEMLNELFSLYNMILNNKLNDIIRVLTIFSVVFIPLTFLAGIYGTNFHYLPELDYRYAYPIFWGVLIVIALGMILFFKRRDWL